MNGLEKIGVVAYLESMRDAKTKKELRELCERLLSELDEKVVVKQVKKKKNVSDGVIRKMKKSGLTYKEIHDKTGVPMGSLFYIVHKKKGR